MSDELKEEGIGLVGLVELVELVESVESVELVGRFCASRPPSTLLITQTSLLSFPPLLSTQSSAFS
jgi:hypothetical protein